MRSSCHQKAACIQMYPDRQNIARGKQDQKNRSLQKGVSLKIQYLNLETMLSTIYFHLDP